MIKSMFTSQEMSDARVLEATSSRYWSAPEVSSEFYEVYGHYSLCLWRGTAKIAQTLVNIKKWKRRHVYYVGDEL